MRVWSSVRAFPRVWHYAGHAFRVLVVIHVLFIAYSVALPFRDDVSWIEITLVVLGYVVAVTYGLHRMKKRRARLEEEVAQLRTLHGVLDDLKKPQDQWPPSMQENLKIVRAEIMLNDEADHD